MAYYSPNDDQYYSPENNVSVASTAASTIAGLAKDLIGFTVVQAVGSAVLKGASRAIGSAFMRGAQSAEMRGAASLAQKRLLTNVGKPTTLSTVFNASEAGQLSISTRTQASYAKFNAPYVARKEALSKIKESSQIDYFKSRVSTAFAKGNKASTALNFLKTNVIGGSAAGFVYDTLSNRTEEMGIKPTNPLNLPGQAINYLKYMKENAVTFAAFGAIGPLAGGSLGWVAGKARTAMSSNAGMRDAALGVLSRLSKPNLGSNNEFGQAVVNNARSMGDDILSKASQNIKAGLNTASSVVRDNVRQMSTGIKSKDDFAPIKKITETITESWKLHKESAAYERKYSDQAGFQLFRTIQAGTAATATNVATAPRSIGDANLNVFNTVIKNHNNGLKGRSIFAEILGLQQATMNDVVSKEFVHTNISERMAHLMPDDAAKKTMTDRLMGVKVGKDIYSSKSGHIVDLGVFSPMNMVSRATKKLAGLNLKLLLPMPPTGRELTLGSITGLNAILSDRVHASVFDKYTTGYGLIAESSGTMGQSKYVPRGMKRTLSQLVHDTGKVLGDDSRVVFMGGKFYHQDGIQVTELAGKDTALKYTHSAAFGVGGEGKSHDNKVWLNENHKFGDVGAQELARINKLNSHGSGMFHTVANSFNWSAPQWLTAAARGVAKNLVPHKLPSSSKYGTYSQGLYLQDVSVLSRENVSADDMGRSIQTCAELLKHTTQEVNGIFKNPHAIRFIETLGLARSSKEFLDPTVMTSNEKFSDTLRGISQRLDIPEYVKQLQRRPEINALTGSTIHYPFETSKTTLFPRMGRLSDTSALDYARVSYVSSNLVEAGGSEVFSRMASELLQSGHINATQSNALRTHGHLTSLFSNKDINLGLPVNDTNLTNVVSSVRSTLKQKNNNALDDINEYIMGTNLRDPYQTLRQTANGTAKIDPTFSRFARNNFNIESVLNEKLHPDYSPFLAIAHDGDNYAFAGASKIFNVAATRFGKLFEDFTGFRIDPFKHGSGAAGIGKYVASVTGKIAAVTTAYNVIDGLIAGNPAFDQTSLNAGITGVVADTVAKAHLMGAAALQYSGISGVARHIEGLMPGFTSSAPGALIGGALRWKTGVGNTLWGAFGGAIINRAISPYTPDLTKTYDQLKEEYAGRADVPIIEAQGWLLGSSPYQGKRVTGWRPNWYVQAKSRWESTDTLYGSEVARMIHAPIFPLGFNVGDLVDPYFMERKHYFDRPVPLTAELGSEIPFGIGPVIAATIGKIIKPQKLMHAEFLYGSGNIESNNEEVVSAIKPPSLKEGRNSMSGDGVWNPRKFSAYSMDDGTFTYSGTKLWGQIKADEMLDGLTESLGMAGFAARSFKNAIIDRPTIVPTLETAGRYASMSRSYYDKSIGGIGPFSEPLRRFLSKQRWYESGVNPIPNLMPEWVGDKFTKGDPYSKIKSGEIRLPGAAYERTHNVRQTMPGRASAFGLELRDLVKYFTGLMPPALKEEFDILEEGTEMHASIQNWLKEENLLVQAEALMYDAKNDISGHIDAIIRDGMGGGGKRVLEIKSINEKALAKLEMPKGHNVGQLNMYLHETGIRKGTLLYISRDNPAHYKMFEVNYNHDRYTDDIQKLKKARSVAGQMLAKGISGDGYGYAYSWFDRLLILADTNPGSAEYKETLQIVQKVIRAGNANDSDIKKYNQAVHHRKATMRKFELYPNRFKGKVLNPDTVADVQSINEDTIQAADQYSLPERFLGSLWESFTNLNTPITNKWFHYKDPLEHYKLMQLYGKEYQPWTDPIGSWAKPWTQQALSQEGVAAGAAYWGMGPGYLLGGRGGAIVGGALGAVYGGFNKATRWMTGSKGYTPGKIDDERQVNEYFDSLKFTRNQRMAELATGLDKEEYIEASRGTLTSILQQGGKYADFFRSVSHREKPYIEAWLNETNHNKRGEILRYIPGNLGSALSRFWDAQDSGVDTKNFIDATSADMRPRKNIRYTNQELDPNIQLDDIKLKTIQSQGLNEHDFGLGWQDQMLRVQNDLTSIRASSIDNPEIYTESNVNAAEVRSSIYTILTRFGASGTVNVYINEHSDDFNEAIVTLQRDNLQELSQGLANRRRYLYDR